MFFFQVERNEDGSVKVVVPTDPTPSPEQIYRRKLYLLGFTEPTVVDEMWAKERKRREDAAAAAKLKVKQRGRKAPANDRRAG